MTRLELLQLPRPLLQQPPLRSILHFEVRASFDVRRGLRPLMLQKQLIPGERSTRFCHNSLRTQPLTCAALWENDLGVGVLQAAAADAASDVRHLLCHTGGANFGHQGHCGGDLRAEGLAHSCTELPLDN